MKIRLGIPYAQIVKVPGYRLVTIDADSVEHAERLWREGKVEHHLRETFERDEVDADEADVYDVFIDPPDIETEEQHLKDMKRMKFTYPPTEPTMETQP
jgi:hypothetical protein